MPINHDLALGLGLVLGELEPTGFYKVDRAEGAIDHWYAIREYELANGQGYASLSITTQLDKLREIVGWIEEAGETLRGLTGDPASIEEPPKLEEATAGQLAKTSDSTHDEMTLRRWLSLDPMRSRPDQAPVANWIRHRRKHS